MACFYRVEGHRRNAGPLAPAVQTATLMIYFRGEGWGEGQTPHLPSHDPELRGSVPECGGKTPKGWRHRSSRHPAPTKTRELRKRHRSHTHTKTLRNTLELDSIGEMPPQSEATKLKLKTSEESRTAPSGLWERGCFPAEKPRAIALG
jgi:hypothetical protein